MTKITLTARLALLALAALAVAAPLSFAADPREIAVTARSADDEIHLAVSLHVDASPREVWAVLVDYDRATRFVSDLKVSRVVSREGNVLRVLQKSTYRFGPFSFPVESLREVRMNEPVRLDSRLISGTLKRSDAVTELVPEGSGTRVRYQSTSVPSSPLPVPLSMVRREAEHTFGELRDEVLRRKAGGRPHSAVAASQ